MPHGAILSLLLAAALGGQAPVADERKSPAAAEVAAAVEKLGSNKYVDRETASDFLWQAGRAALTALETAANDKDAERAKRAMKLLEKVRWGLTPDVDPATAAVINAYRLAQNHGAKQGVLIQLRDKQQFALLIDLLLADPTYPKAADLALTFGREIRAAAMESLADDPARAEAILRWRMRHNLSNLGLIDYAAYLTLTGKQDETEARLRRDLKLEEGGDSARLLAALLLYQGRDAEARAVAAATSDEYLKIEIAFRLGDWKTMAEKYPPNGTRGVEQLGFALKFATLSGDTTTADQARAAIKEWPKTQTQQAWLSCEALLLNERWEEADQVVKSDAENRRVELLCDQMRYREALEGIGPRDKPGWAARWYAEAAEKLDPTKPDGQLHFLRGIQVGRVLHQTAQNDEAETLFEELATRAAQNHPALYWGPLLEMELRLGRREQAERHILKLLGDEAGLAVATQKFFKQQAGLASVWWGLLRLHSPQEDLVVTWRRLQAWMKPGDVRPKGPTLAELLKTGEKYIPTGDLPTRPGRWSALAEVCRMWGDASRALHYRQQQILALAAVPGNPLLPTGMPAAVGVLLAVGDLHFGEKQWTQAADAYEKAWQRRRIDPLPLYLQGLALEKGGKVDEGRALMRRAELMPLADTDLRRTLAAGLQERGLNEAAREQRRQVWRLGQRSTWDFNILNVAETEAKDLGREGIAEAAQYWSYLPYGLFRPATAMPETLGYRELAQAIHKGRAWTAMDAGRWDEALAELKLAQDARPGYSAFAETTVARLDAVGRKTDADAIFARTYDVYETACRDFPESAWHHNGAAWVASQCNRRLDDALKHAETAVRLKPDTSAYLDTLAEVHFRRGDVTKAIEIEEQAVKLAPNDADIAAQMKKFQAAAEKK